jgi:tetratricopeptide (TPR) repeat protein
MISTGRIVFRFGATCAVWLALTAAAISQEATLENLVEAGRAAMREKDWPQALELHTQAVTRFGQNDPLREFGAQFGAVFYHKGVCELKLRKWAEAMRSFETCYRDFPNTGRDPGNPFQLLALCKWGEAAMGAEDWELAASRFAKFVSERNRTRDKFPQGSFYVNSAVCQYKLGRIPEGNENLEIAIQNKADFPTPQSGIVAGFEALVGAAIAGRNEQALLDFIGRNRGALVTDSPEDTDDANVFLKLAGEALAVGMKRAALAIYQLLPPSSANIAGADTPESIRLAAIALIHEMAGNMRGAYASYLQLEANHPDAKSREHHLYQLIRTASVIGEFQCARNHAWKLRRDFPDSALLAAVRASGVDPAEDVPGGIPAAKPKADEDAAPAKALPQSRAFATALDLYQGRKYHEAMAAFLQIKNRREPASGPETAAFAGFYAMECLRKSGDLMGLGKALSEYKGTSSLDAGRLRQLEINRLWDAVGAKDWDRANDIAGRLESGPLAVDQRAQVAFCWGLALENRGHPAEALIAHNIAMTVDAGTSEEIARQAALRVLALHRADPEVQAAMDGWGTADENRHSPGFFRLQEAAAVAVLFELSLGAGTPLPAELSGFLKYKGDAQAPSPPAPGGK